jgi:small subunit ribosomal protein S17
MDKTAVVSVERRYPHPLYHKIVRSTKRYKAHDAENKAVLGDVVRIVETRPLSKEKRWRIAETMVHGNVAELAPREIGAPEESLYHPEAPVAVVAAPAPVVETPAPVVETPAPVLETPTPVVETPAPVVEIPAPVVEIPAPVLETPTPVVETPMAEEAPAEVAAEAAEAEKDSKE